MIPTGVLTDEQARRIVTPLLIAELDDGRQALIDMLADHAERGRVITDLFKRCSERDRRVQALISAQVACR